MNRRYRSATIRKRLMAGLVSLLLVLPASACGRLSSNTDASAEASDSTASTAGQREEAADIPAGPGVLLDSYQAVVQAASGYQGDADGTGGGSSAGSDFFGNASDAEKCQMALELADDMAESEFFGLMTPDMMAIGAEAAAGYPHPLLLNNYGAMVLAWEGPEAALPFAQLAVDQESANPVLLTNLANLKLELGDDSAAEQLVKQALAADNEFGPAYQVLTTLHLKRDQSVLAAETMIKSARRYFDDLTRYQFDSYLAACDALDPEKDEYPLKEAYLDILYEIAKENVDTLDNGKGTDTPAGQLTLKPFPQITGADNLKNSRDWIEAQIKGIGAARSAAEKRRSPYSGADDSMYEYADISAGTYPVARNFRQIYAIRVMTSFYDFRILQRDLSYEKEIQEIFDQREQSKQKITDKYAELDAQADLELDDAQTEMWTGLIGALDGGELPDIKALQTAGLLKPRLRVEEAKEGIAVTKRHAGEVVTVSAKYYADLSQMLEEYWLKTGGLLKYLAEEDQFEKQAAEREIFVYERLPEPLYELQYLADTMLDEEERLGYAEQELAMLEQAFAGTAAAYDSAVAEEEKEKREENGEEMVPDIEKEAFTKYPEPGDLGDIGVEADAFGLAGGSVQFNGDRFKVETESIVHKTDNGYNELLRGNLSSTLYGVTATGDTEWITKSNLGKMVPKAGALGKVGKVFGKIGFGATSGTKIGKYVVRDANGQIVDRGIHYLRESGGNIGLFGKSSKVEVFKSQMKGYSLKSTGSKYKFWFATYEE